ncbi:MAG: extracellular solute-binding protein, partial [Caloramator sp.]|nr:extracellular solute-binding protein [Caloramator sp.]
MKKFLALVFSALMIFNLLGCGGKTAKKEEVKEVTINIWEQMEENIDATFDEVAKQFTEQNPHIKINRVHYKTEDLRSQFQTAVLSGQGPELIFGPNDNIGPMYLGNLIIPLDDFLGKE